MTNVILILFLTLSLSDRHITSAVSQNTLATSNENSGSHNRDTSDKKKGHIPWTTEFQSQLIRIWDTTDPEKEGQPMRMYGAWCALHPEYSKVTPNHLKRYAESIIRQRRSASLEENDERQQDRLRYLRSKEKFFWTTKLKEDLLMCYRAVSSEEKGYKTELYRLWAEKHPQYAYLKPRFLAVYAQKFSKEENAKPQSDKEEVRTPDRSIRWNDDLKAELMEIWDKTYNPHKKTGHLEEIYRLWTLKHPELPKVTPKYLKFRADTLIHEDTIERISRGEDNEQLRARMNYIKGNKKRIVWTPELISDLQTCWNGGKRTGVELLEKWKRMHEDCAHTSWKNLARNAKYHQEKLRVIQNQSEGSRNLKRSSRDHSQSTEEGTNQDLDSRSRQRSRTDESATGQHFELKTDHQSPHRNPNQHQSQLRGHLQDYDASSSETARPKQSIIGHHPVLLTLPLQGLDTNHSRMRYISHPNHHQPESRKLAVDFHEEHEANGGQIPHQINHISLSIGQFGGNQAYVEHRLRHEQSQQSPSQKEHDLDLDLHLK